ncbi:proteasome accessory factor PafA2 family protein [Luteococcus sanguinis]|uniref:Proteasome accessory factor PafA2 family protein n=1 Tax=Luteococcus sanguinis TaxID=174038 RepID=A0ABW1X406_9ACTN
MGGTALSVRAHGLETEYGLQVRVLTASGRWRRLGSDEAGEALFAPVAEANRATNVYLRNGGRLYLDVGSHPEYATAECATIGDLVAQDRAGDVVVDQLADRLVEHLADQGEQARVSVFKNNVDSHGNSWGSHENYQVAREPGDGVDELADALSGFLVTRQLTSGAGHWERDRLGVGRFLLSQRAAHMWDPVGTATTRSRPLVNTRDEPHADPARHRRLHVICGDSTLIDATTALRVGSTELVLRAIEAGQRLDAMVPADTGPAIRAVAGDVTGRVRFDGRAGQLTALDVQRAWWQLTAPFADDDELRRVHETWGRVLDAVQDDRLDEVAHLVDWVAKRRVLLAEQGRRGLRADDPRLAQIDLVWHDIRSGQGLCRLAEARGQVERWVGADVVRRAVDQPPVTRAALRSRFVTAAQQNQRQYTVDWMRFTCHDLADGHASVPDPLCAQDVVVDELVARMASEPRTSAMRRVADPRGPEMPPVV